MNTQNVNVKTAAHESSRKMGGEDLRVTADQISALLDVCSGRFKKGVTVSMADVSRYGDIQVEIRVEGRLDWRAWSFEPDFLTDLERHLSQVKTK